VCKSVLHMCRYTAHIGVVLLNKFLLSLYGFKCPVLLTLLHMLACSALCTGSVALGLVRIQWIRTRAQLSKIALLSLVFTVTIILGNVSLRYIPVSFNQAIGACTPLFTAALSFLIQGKRESARTYATLVPVVVGIAIASGFEPSFHLFGFLTCMSATALRAFKSVLQACSRSLASLQEPALALQGSQAVSCALHVLSPSCQQLSHGICRLSGSATMSLACRQSFCSSQTSI
jgi:drug/metabolite transporter (DMT)-like permease